MDTRSGLFRTHSGQLLSNRYFIEEKWVLSPLCTPGFYQQNAIQAGDPSTEAHAAPLVKCMGWDSLQGASTWHTKEKGWAERERWGKINHREGLESEEVERYENSSSVFLKEKELSHVKTWAYGKVQLHSFKISYCHTAVTQKRGWKKWKMSQQVLEQEGGHAKLLVMFSPYRCAFFLTLVGNPHI